MTKHAPKESFKYLYADMHTQSQKHIHHKNYRAIYLYSYNILFFPLFLTNVFFTVDLLAGQPADWTTIEIIALLIIYLPGTRALLRQLIKPVKDL